MKINSAEMRKILVLAFARFRRGGTGASIKKPLEHSAATFGVLSNCIKNRRFWEVVEPIIILWANRYGYSYIRAAFRGLHSEKQPPEDNTPNAKLYSELENYKS